MLPFSCDALLPIGDRYASQKFRRYARTFKLTKMTWEEACELIAFLHICPLHAAKYVFHWNSGAAVRARKLWGNAELQADAADWAIENRRAVGVSDGLAVLDAMRDGGWRVGVLPMVVAKAVAELRHNGWSTRDVAARTGLSPHQINRAKSQRVSLSTVTHFLPTY